MNTDILFDTRDSLLGWSLRQALQPGATVAFVSASHDHTRTAIADLHSLMTNASVGGHLVSIERTMHITGGGRIWFLTFERALRLCGAEFSDVAIHGLSFVPWSVCGEVPPFMRTRNRLSKQSGEPNRMAFAD